MVCIGDLLKRILTSLANPRLAVMTRSLEKMNKERKKDIFKK